MKHMGKELSMLPQLLSDINEKIVRRYSSSGTYELTKTDKNIIDEMERSGKKFKTKVLCVIQSTVLLGATEVETTNYVYVDNELTPYEFNSRLMITAKCINHTWELDDYGVIGIEESHGRIIRTY